MAISQGQQDTEKTTWFQKFTSIDKKAVGAKSPWGNIGLSLLLPVLLIIVWELASRFNYVAPHQLPAPTIIVQTIWAMALDGSLWTHTSITLYRVFLGFLWGTLAAVVLGSIVGMFSKAETMFDPMIQAFRAIPSLAWVPLFILWLGIGEGSKITLIAVGVFFPVYLNITGGIQSVDRKLIEVGKAYGLSTYQLVKRIILPASLPSFFIGLRSGLGLGWMFVVAAELMGASQGLGFLLVFGQNMSQPAVIISSIILFAILGKITDTILKKFQEKALHWQDTMEKSQGK
ncbi:sulfonate transport system permease protein [Evansella vedderi]|uniref:Sulfonate transport system permease protein n=1 Tax=Evansella vedderi TaxID=38282 RepID=A0ABT9ZV84_9BACI|nr:ABC transporter permease [Evansella vedderi]MDQ0254636.1 sulfonate transport system permease protein [Evansella vedderi]